jgi:hypothetical protein
MLKGAERRKNQRADKEQKMAETDIKKEQRVLRNRKLA